MAVVEHIKKLKEALCEASFFYRLVVLLLSGVTLSFVQAPYNLWPLLFPALGLFYFLFTQATNKKQAFASAFFFAFGYHVAGLYWIGNALLVEGNEFVWVWPFAVIGLPILLALFPALYLTLSHVLFKRPGRSGFIGFCVLLALSEWVRGYAFTGFPWNLYGYGWGEVLPVAQIVSIVGPYGLTLLTVLWGSFFGFLFLDGVSHGKKISLGVGLVFIFFGVFAFGVQQLQEEQELSNEAVQLRIVQPNIEQAEKWQADKLGQNFEKHIQLSGTPFAGVKTIIVWPETSLPPSFLQNAAVRERIHSVLGKNDVLLAGALDITRDVPSGAPRYHNALVSWQKGQDYRRLYSKSHLVPFGEYIPFQRYIPIPTVTQFSGFERGEGPHTVGSFPALPSFSPLICYEVIFPHLAVAKDQPRPDYILTVTNDAWYGDSPGPYQHFSQARFRAIEQGLPVVRAANNGVSGVIDAYGRIVTKTNLMEDFTLKQSFITGKSSPTSYYRYGDIIFLISIILGIFVAILFREKHFS